jgi:GPI inositol-deacylase
MPRRSSGSPIEDASGDPPVIETSVGAGDAVNTPRISDNAGLEVAKEADNHDRRKEDPGSVARARTSGNWKRPSPVEPASEKKPDTMIPLAQETAMDKMEDIRRLRRARLRSPWSCSLSTLATTATAFLTLLAIVQSFFNRQIDPSGCGMPSMRPMYAHFADFDTEHTRFASKYSLYLYGEGGIDNFDPEAQVRFPRLNGGMCRSLYQLKVKGVPVLFIPGNAGSYRQVRSLASEASIYFHEMADKNAAISNGVRSLDFFSVDFNEDITAFHGQTLLDQAEYLNDAVAYILSLYHDPRRSSRDPNLPDPSSVILVGHSMGGIVARTMLTLSNYQSNSVNTIVTMSAPHARAPVSFDSDIVQTYKKINDYWRQSYSQKWNNNNPLWHVTLISIAGGSLDTIVPSDYASLSSLVPDTNGFTVFTSTIPNVWTGMDHLAITWCDQFRKVVIRSLYDVVDVRRSSQTKPRAERMRMFKRWFLTGMEPVAEKSLRQKSPSTLLTLEDGSKPSIQQDQRLILRGLGRAGESKAHLLPIPPQGHVAKKFTFLTNQRLDRPEDHGTLEVLFCSVSPLHGGQSAVSFSTNMDLSGNTSGSTRLACKNAAEDTITLPASNRKSKYPFDQEQPFSYLEYHVNELAEHQFVAVVDKSNSPQSGWVVAEFSNVSDSKIVKPLGLLRLLSTGMHVKLPASRPMVTELQIPALHSSLLAYSLKIGKQSCGDDAELFTPLMRQYLTEPYESKYFVNVKEANINLHGIAPYMPPSLRGLATSNGISLQLWSDPSCDTSIDVALSVDIPGSLGKLVMRYRTVFAAFPLLVVALVLRKQFKVYDETGVFMTFAESMTRCLRTSLPLLLLAMSFLASSLATSSHSPTSSTGLFHWSSNGTESAIDFTKNDLLLGSQDSFFWFLVPLFGVIAIGICIALNYVVLAIVHILAIGSGLFVRKPAYIRIDDKRY